MGVNALTVYQGDDKLYDVFITDEDNEPIDITNYTFKFTVKCKFSETTPEIQKTTGGGGISIVEAEEGQIRITLTSTDTELEPGKYIYDVEATDVSNRVTTVLFDNFVVKKDVS